MGVWKYILRFLCVGVGNHWYIQNMTLQIKYTSPNHKYVVDPTADSKYIECLTLHGYSVIIGP